MTRRRSWFNPVNKVAKTSETKGAPTEGPNWTTWDEDTVEGALQEEGHGDEAITLVSGYPITASRPACRVSYRASHPPLPTSFAKRGQSRISHTPMMPLDTSTKPVRPITPFKANPRCISFQSASSDTSFRSLRSSTPGLTDSTSCYSSSSSSPVSTPRSGSPFSSPSDCTPTTTLLQTPPPSPTASKDSPPISVYQPVFRPATPHPRRTFSTQTHLPVYHAY